MKPAENDHPPPRRIGICSWSLRPPSVAQLVEQTKQVGVDAIQLELDPLIRGDWTLEETVGQMQQAEIAIVSGMIRMAGEDYTTLDSIRMTGGVRPDAHWERNRAHATAGAELARKLQLTQVTFHGGFIPHDPRDPERRKLLDRLGALATIFGDQMVNVGLETGQESADTLLRALADMDHPNLGVNFDPANMILYGMGDPVDAFEQLAPYVVGVHIKDALPTQVAGTWGREVAVGEGAVDWPAFFHILHNHAVEADLMIEREAGSHTVDDMRAARQHISTLLEPRR